MQLTIQTWHLNYFHRKRKRINSNLTERAGTELGRPTVRPRARARVFKRPDRWVPPVSDSYLTRIGTRAAGRWIRTRSTAAGSSSSTKQWTRRPNPRYYGEGRGRRVPSSGELWRGGKRLRCCSAVRLVQTAAAEVATSDGSVFTATARTPAALLAPSSSSGFC